jgi:hypothetical protein
VPLKSLSCLFSLNFHLLNCDYYLKLSYCKFILGLSTASPVPPCVPLPACCSVWLSKSDKFKLLGKFQFQEVLIIPISPLPTMYCTTVVAYLHGPACRRLHDFNSDTFVSVWECGCQPCITLQFKILYCQMINSYPQVKIRLQTP